VGLPDDDSRMAILKEMLNEMLSPSENIDLVSLTTKTKELSGAFLNIMCQHAHKLAIREVIQTKKKEIRKSTMDVDEKDVVPKPCQNHFDEALRFVQRLAYESETSR